MNPYAHKQGGRSRSEERHPLVRIGRIMVAEGQRISIAISIDEQDDVSNAIAAGTFGLPLHYPLLALVEPGARVLDLGAHIGTFSLYAASHGYKVAAVEASQENAALLDENLRRNGYFDVQVIHGAISDYNGLIDFRSAGPYGHVSTGQPGERGNSVQCFTVERIVETLGWESVDFLKIDIEGSEVSALREMGRGSSRCRPRFLLFEANGHTLGMFSETPRSLLYAVEELGFSSFLVLPGRLIATRPDEVQAECVVDYLAVGAGLEFAVPGWRVETAMPEGEKKARILEACAHPHPHYRAHISRELKAAPAWICNDDEIKRAARLLCEV